MTAVIPVTTVDEGRRAARRPGRPAAGQLVCWQVAAAGVLATIGRPMPVTVAAGVAAAVLVVVSTGRVRGRWLFEWVRLWLRYRSRDRRLTAHAASAPEAALLALVAGVEPVPDRTVDGRRFAVVEHPGGVGAVVGLGTEGLTPDMLDLPALVLASADPDGPHQTVQVVLHIRPVPTGWYGRAWLTVQIGREPGQRPEELRRALDAALRRTLRLLRRHGRTHEVLAAAGLHRDLYLISQRDLTERPAPGRDLAVEAWDAWRTPGVAHRTLLLGGAATRAPGQSLVGMLLTADGLGTTVSLTRRRPAPGPDTVSELTVRLTSRTGAGLDAVVRALRNRLTPAGVTVDPLDGRQAYGLAATLPLGYLPLQSTV